MPSRFDVGQLYPLAGHLGTLLVAGGRGVVVSSVVACNTVATRRRFRLAVARAGDVQSDKQYLYFDTPIPPNDTFVATLGITLPPGSELRAYSDGGGVAFNAFHNELS